jgi:probable HAF family extracellular repeat protein
MRRFLASRVLTAPLIATFLSGVVMTTPVLAAPSHTKYASVTDLGTPRGFLPGDAAGLNDRGEVASSVRINEDSPETHVAVWRDGKWSDFGPGAAAGITRDGSVVGYSGADPHATEWNRHGRPKNLGVLPGGFWSQATAANDRGQVVGYGQSTGTQAFIWDQQRGVRQLSAGPKGYSYAYGINDAGQVVGAADNEAVMWDQAGARHKLGAGAASIAYGINERGLVVGDANGRAFAWSSARAFRYLPVPRGVGTSIARAVNDAGQIVGSAQVTRVSALPEFHAVLWQDGTMRDLNDVLPARSGWQLETATAINRRGQILGNGIHNGQERAFLLTLPEVDD